MSSQGLEAGVEGVRYVSATILGPVGTALSAAVSGAESWIGPADAAAIAGLEVLADAIDAMSTAAEPDYKELGMLVSRFLNGAGMLGLTPFGRGRLELEGEVSDAGAELVALVGGRTAAG